MPLPQTPPSQVAEDPTFAFDLASALSRAWSENPLLKAARARVDERRGQITSTLADALPKVDLVGDFTRSRDVSILNNSFGQTASSVFGIDPASLVKPQTVYTTQLQVQQTVFNFGKLTGAVAIARLGEKEAEAAFETAQLDVLHGVARAYLGALAAEADLEVVKARQGAAQRFVDDVKAKLELEAARQLDLLRAQAELLQARTEGIQLESAHRRALELLNGELGLDPRTRLKLAPMGPPPETGAAVHGGERSELRQLLLQQGMLEKNRQVITSDLLPKLELNASAGYQAGSTDHLFKQPYDTWRVSLNLKVPLFDGLRVAGRRAQNNAQLTQVRQATVDAERRLLVERTSAERELVQARAYRDTAAEAHAAAEEALRTSREAFDLGLISSLDLLQTERAERQAESLRRKAELGVWQAHFNLRRALGLAPSIP